MNKNTPIEVDKIISAKWIIPIRPSKTVLNNHSIAILGSKIVAILPTNEIMQQFSCNEQVNFDSHLLMPGLINTHGHAAMSLFRGMADDLALEGWLSDHIWPAEALWVSDKFVKEGSQLAIAEMLRSGTTCYSDMYFFPESGAQAALESGIRAQFSFPIFDFPSAWGRDADDYIHKGLAARDQWQHHPNINFIFGPHAPYTVSDDPLKRIATLSAELDIGIQIHCHETAQEVTDALAKDGERPLQRLDRLGLLSPTTQLVHMTALNDSDIELVRQTGAHVIHCPESNMKLASGFCPTTQLLDANINVALGTDSAASNNDLNLFSEMKTAALLAKATSGNAAALNDWQALEMATLSGAKALGLENDIGSLEVGKEADFIAIDFSQLEQQPIHEPASHLVYTQMGHHVTHSWVAGQLVLKDRQPTQMSLPLIMTNTKQWQDKIKQHNK